VFEIGFRRYFELRNSSTPVILVKAGDPDPLFLLRNFDLRFFAEGRSVPRHGMEWHNNRTYAFRFIPRSSHRSEVRGGSYGELPHLTSPILGEEADA